ncbi:MAG: S41 family peptidase [Colwellia sp.]|nr:S41 family peptidase [Colwellia sp.]
MQTIKPTSCLTKYIRTSVIALAVSFTFTGMSNADQYTRQQADKSITAKQKQGIINQLITKMNQSYIFPDKAKAFERLVREKETNGDYHNIISSQKLEKILNEQLSSVTNDGHLVLSYSEHEVPTPSNDLEQTKLEQNAELKMMRSLNWGIEKIERFSFNIGYLELSMFADSEHAAETIAAAMTMVSNTEALIIDLRFSRGGDPDTVALLASYFLDKRTHLSNMLDREGNVSEQMWSSNSVRGKRYGQQRDLYILTSQDTYSAAEDFAYTLKHLKRATIIGATTGGGAHPGDFIRLSPHFEVFIPSERSLNPITKTNWEGKGVIPDIRVLSENALNTAQVVILNKLKGSEQDPRRVERIKARIAKL